jgi:hypothetical protein
MLLKIVLKVNEPKELIFVKTQGYGYTTALEVDLAHLGMVRSLAPRGQKKPYTKSINPIFINLFLTQYKPKVLKQSEGYL